MNHNEQACAAVVAVVASAYPSAKFSAQTVAVWVDSLVDLDPQSLGMAVRKLIATSKFCPSIAEVRAACLDQRVAPGELTAGEAWAAVLDAISSFGWARTPAFADELVERALQCTIGWYELCTSDVSDMPSHRARFLAAYEGLQRRVREGWLLPDSLRQQIADARRDSAAGVLDATSPAHESISEQAQRARALVADVGRGGTQP